jgi:uncharacterized protein (TIGR03437 family)
MVHTIRSGRGAGVRICALAAFFLIFCFGLSAQTPTCTPSAAALTVHSEGLAEQVGDIKLACSGGAGTVSTLLAVVLNGNITNRLDAAGNLLGVTLTGATSPAPPTISSANTLLFSQVQVAGASASITVSGIRVAVPTLTGTSAPLYVTANVAASALTINSQALFVGLSVPTLLTSSVNYGIPCTGSPLPASTDFPGLIGAGTTASTVRVTEASPSSFAPRFGNADSGVRILVQLSGYGSNAQVFVPDVIVGNLSPSPTSAGLFGASANGGSYTPGNNQVLLARVSGADSTGAGGVPVLPGAPIQTQAFTTVTTVSLTNGAGSVTYEVIAANGALTDSAQIPVFVSAPASSCAVPQVTTLTATVAPTSTASIPTETDPIPRFVATTPGSDCNIIGDCSAPYFSSLQVGVTSLAYSSSSLGPIQNSLVAISNGGTAQMPFSVSASYVTATNQSVANWLSINGNAVTSTSGVLVTGVVNPQAGIQSFTLTVAADPTLLLIPGTYQATISVNAGSAGTASIPVTFSVGPAGPVIQSVVNAANFQPGAIAPGSFATIYGLNLVAQQKATVTFNGFPASIFYDGQPSATSKSQINLLVPAGLAGSAKAGVAATIDGTVSNSFVVNLTPNAPAVFSPGIRNQDNSVNTATGPASAGDIIQIFLTGLATPVSVPVTVSIGTQTLSGSQLIYAGAQPSIAGMQQVNVQVPTGLTAAGNSVPLAICVPGAASQPICSAPVSLYIK